MGSVGFIWSTVSYVDHEMLETSFIQKKKMLETSLSHLQFEPNITPTVSLQTSLYIAEKFDDNKTEHCKGIVIYY